MKHEESVRRKAKDEGKWHKILKDEDDQENKNGKRCGCSKETRRNSFMIVKEIVQRKRKKMKEKKSNLKE